MKHFIMVKFSMTLIVSILLPFSAGRSVHKNADIPFVGNVRHGTETTKVLNKCFMLFCNEKGLYNAELFAEGSGLEERKVKESIEIDASGSSLPDCSHACGACFPCKRVMVSFKCAIAESCPIVYRCMCKGRYFHVPSH
ncbi:protein EPIDERMAL PATTERNING FACTOR 2-like isoform X1 [Amborella trichopoda]|uniref:protein EPIDERMAL PATTERNING FACTOR 2-like isoform X1 n=1 Tax=Amborella trichopoda TaxID=13333 RepID=UPI0009BFE4A5|nr:protein EPIDERMAL PATTERNING FACTOR 2-like isoform X1 [Amborella trichopoda]|eukprot:XP_020521726.1 protein EPIDERMAL PATTERNING FACTOR 2-like isoform X1 [Amborella trichopoda]